MIWLSQQTTTHSDAKDESPVAVVIFWFALIPHALHGVFDDTHGAEEMLESIHYRRDTGICRHGVKQLYGTLHERSSMLDHVDVCQDETSFRR